MKFNKNLKLFTAVAEKTKQFELLKSARMNSVLYSAYYFVKSFGKEKKIMPEKLENTFTNVIQDSGIFTAVYGAGKNDFEKNKIDDYFDKLMEFSLKRTKKARIVEFDIQDVIGPEKTWQYRERMHNELPGRTIIDVFHACDKKKGLDRMIEFSDYLAFSMKEMKRVIGIKNALKLATYIKNKKPEIDIHLLGFSDLRIIDQFNFCTSADSSSWLYPASFGVMYGVRTNQCGKEKIISEMKNLGYDENWAETQKKQYLLTIYFLEMTKKMMTEKCGPQD